MDHLAIMCPATPGHLHPLTTLGNALQRRGHRVTFVAPLDAEAIVTAAGLGFAPYAPEEYYRGANRDFIDRASTMGTLRMARFTFRMLARVTDMLLRHAPQVLRSIGASALVADEFERSASTLAATVGIPFFTVCTTLPTKPEPTIPPFVVPWPYRDTALSRVRNRLAHGFLRWLMSENLHTINRYRVRHGMRPLDDPRNSWSELAVICQVPGPFDYPRRALPPCFHYVGSLASEATRVTVDFPFDALASRPLVYAALGTLAGERAHVFETIAAACAGLDVQLVISLGERGKTLPKGLPGDPIVVDFAPQLALLERAQLMITHAGMNSTLECLRAGVPMVAIPLCNDQPGVAARIAWSGTGEVVPLRRLSVPRLSAAIKKVLGSATYRERARGMSDAMKTAGGADRAAEIIDTALVTGRPVLNDRAS